MLKLQPGDVVIGSQFGKYTKYVIDRVTSKMAFSGKSRFWIEYHEHGWDSGWIKAVGGASSWASSMSYRLATDESLSKYNIQKMVYKLNNCDWESLGEKKLAEIISIINK